MPSTSSNRVFPLEIVHARREKQSPHTSWYDDNVIEVASLGPSKQYDEGMRLETFADLPRMSGPLFATSEKEKHYGACSPTMGARKVATVVHYKSIIGRSVSEAC